MGYQFLLIHGSRVAIGNYKNNTQGYAEIYEYSESSDSWTQLGSDIEGVGSADNAGLSVSLNAIGDTMAIGSQMHDSQKGHVRILGIAKIHGHN